MTPETLAARLREMATDLHDVAPVSGYRLKEQATLREAADALDAADSKATGYQVAIANLKLALDAVEATVARLTEEHNTCEAPCANPDEGKHCRHWYDGGPCCGCQAKSLEEVRRRGFPQGVQGLWKSADG